MNQRDLPDKPSMAERLFSGATREFPLMNDLMEMTLGEVEVARALDELPQSANVISPLIAAGEVLDFMESAPSEKKGENLGKILFPELLEEFPRVGELEGMDPAVLDELVATGELPQDALNLWWEVGAKSVVNSARTAFPEFADLIDQMVEREREDKE